MEHQFAKTFVIAFALMASATLFADAPTGTPSTVVASQGTATVTLDDVDVFAHRIPEGNRAGFFDNPQRIESAISGMLLQKQLVDEARAHGVDKDPQVQREISMAADEALAAAWMNRLRTEVKPPDFAPLAREEYIAHKENYNGRAFADVKDEIVERLRNAYIEKAVGDHRDQLRNNKLDANPDLVASLRTRYGSPAAPPQATTPAPAPTPPKK